ncbi:MAG TPA: AGE family epimerase/isomerase [Verrucomicrobiae bacterium]|nr:AGE family epimerase/isomerase [Verrucomicrobiae bacterium]
MHGHKTIALLAALFSMTTSSHSQNLADVAAHYRTRLESNLTENIVGFWLPKTVDFKNGGYILNHDIAGAPKGGGSKMIVTQARMVWFFSHLARSGYGGKQSLEAADAGYRFLKDKMWDPQHGGFYWQVDMTGAKQLRAKKHVYGQSFALYALSEYYLATGRQEALDLATRLFHLLEDKAHDAKFGGYTEWFNEDWTPASEEISYMGEPALKLMNTHLHLLESMTCFYRASRLPLARERLLELITIESDTVVRKGLGACTDKYLRDWTPVLTGNYARVSYGHDLENIWLLIDACDAAGLSTYPLQDLYRTMFEYSTKYGFDETRGGFYNSGRFNQPADNLEKTWWVQAEALVSALYMHRLTHDPKYLHVFEKTYDWVEQHQVDWKNGEWFEAVNPQGHPTGDKATIWKAGYHNGRAMMECLAILKSQP